VTLSETQKYFGGEVYRAGIGRASDLGTSIPSFSRRYLFSMEQSKNPFFLGETQVDWAAR